MNEILKNLMAGGLDEERAHAVIEHRARTIKKPLTAYAAKLLVKRLAEWGDPNEAADIMIEKVWQGFDTSWVRNAPRPQQQRHTQQPAPQRVGDLFREDARRMNDEYSAGHLDAGNTSGNGGSIGELIQFAIPGRR